MRLVRPPEVPMHAHLIWFGETFPWVNLLAVRSAALRGGFDTVFLHHDSDLSGTPYYAELRATPRVVLRRLDVQALLARCEPYSAQLQALFDRLRTHPTRSDLVRFALLYSEGGVYLDIDTVTLRSFAPLCRGVHAFCGEERLVFPASVRNSRNPITFLAAQVRSLLRSVLRVTPRGWAFFRAIESWYPLGANPAVMGSSAGSRFITESIEQLLSIPPARQVEPCVIGPHLLQEMVKRYSGDDLAVHPSGAFFPLGPEISAHWFRNTRFTELEQVLAQAHIVHWYASVRTKQLVPRINPDYVRFHAERQLFSKLALPFVDG
jgi:hypothetical protein